MKKEIFGYYDLYDDGRIFSKLLGRFMKPIRNTSGYYYIMLAKASIPRMYSISRLVLGTFGSSCPDGMECHHIDHNKGNNHVNNLEWVTHSENILRSFSDGGRKGYWLGKKKEAFSEATRSKMAMAKYVPIRARGKDIVDYESIGACAKGLGTYREKVYRYIRNGKLLNGYKLEYVQED